MNTTEYIRLCLVKRGNLSVAELAEKTGQTRQNLSNKIQRNEWKQSELEKIAAALDSHLEIKFIDNATGQPII